MKTNKAFWAITVGLSLTSCGSGSSSANTAAALSTTTTTTTTVGSVSCSTANEFSVNGINCTYAPAGTFDSACVYAGGLVQTSTFNNGADICQTRTPIVESEVFSYIPELLAGTTFGTGAVEDTRYMVNPGDQLVVISNTSQFGTYSGGFFKSCSPSTPPSGQGLYIADNVTSYSAQTPGSVIAVQGSGYLQFGFNTTCTTGCSTIQAEIYLVRCMDSSGHIYTCPNTGI